MGSMLKRVFCALESNNVEFLISTRNELIEKFGTLQKLSDGTFLPESGIHYTETSVLSATFLMKLGKSPLSHSGKIISHIHYHLTINFKFYMQTEIYLTVFAAP